MESPIKTWREEAGLSQLKLATESNISLMTVIRNEQGLYPDPSPKIISTLINYGAGPAHLSDDDPWPWYESVYHRFQVITRSKFIWAMMSPLPSVDACLAVETHPFQMWRESLGFNERLAFCRAACVPPPQVLNYETARQRTMPKSIVAALSPFVSLSDLNKAGKEYYDAVND